MSSLKLSGPLDNKFKPRMSLSKYHVTDENFASGCFGKIMLAKDGKAQEVVIKRLPKERSSTEDDVLKEIGAGRTLHHRNIARFVEHFSTDDADYLVFERVHGSDLFRLIEKRNFSPYSEQETRKIFKQILRAIKHSHSFGIVHRDIKLENILMDSLGNITVIDYGLCDIVANGQSSQKFCGSLDYVAPEVVCKRAYNGFMADVFSLGIVLYTLLFAEFPFVSKDRMNAIKNRLPQPPIAFAESKMRRLKISPEARDLISKMLRPDPSQRISIDEVGLHPYMQEASDGDN